MCNKSEQDRATPKAGYDLDELKRAKQREAERYGMIQGGHSGLMNETEVNLRRDVQMMLLQKAAEQEHQAECFRRLSEIVGAASPHDHVLFVALRNLLQRA